MTSLRSRARLLSRSLAGVCLLGALAAGSTASAQSSADALPDATGFDLHLFRPAVHSKGLFTLNGTDILGAGSVSFGLVADVGAGLARIGNNDAALATTFFSGTFHANI